MGNMNSRKSYPSYLELYETGELEERVNMALADLEECRICPRDCGVNRLKDEWGVCKVGRYALVSSYFPHFGEEDCLRGWRGSGTIFFAMCNLRCVFCQNYDISHYRKGQEVTPEKLADMMIELQNLGCHNINWVTPEHVVPQILETLPIAIRKGLHIPIVYNTSAFDSLESLWLLEGIVDIYMPDFKFWDPELARKYLKARKYPEVARQVIKEMHRQVGDLVIDENGLAVRGLLVRHLVMPGHLQDTLKILEFLATEISSNTYVNIMNQYHPTGQVGNRQYQEINRPLSRKEFLQALHLAQQVGMCRLDKRRFFMFE